MKDLTGTKIKINRTKETKLIRTVYTKDTERQDLKLQNLYP